MVICMPSSTQNERFTAFHSVTHASIPTCFASIPCPRIRKALSTKRSNLGTSIFEKHLSLRHQVTIHWTPTRLQPRAYNRGREPIVSNSRYTHTEHPRSNPGSFTICRGEFFDPSGTKDLVKREQQPEDPRTRSVDLHDHAMNHAIMRERNAKISHTPVSRNKTASRHMASKRQGAATRTMKTLCNHIEATNASMRPETRTPSNPKPRLAQLCVKTHSDQTSTP